MGDQQIAQRLKDFLSLKKTSPKVFPMKDMVANTGEDEIVPSDYNNYTGADGQHFMKDNSVRQYKEDKGQKLLHAIIMENYKYLSKHQKMLLMIAKRSVLDKNQMHEIDRQRRIHQDQTRPAKEEEE